MSDTPDRLVLVLAHAGRAPEAAADTGEPVVVADPDGARAGAAAAAVVAAGGRAACFAVGQWPAEEERAAVEALAAECLGATRVQWR